MHAASCASVTAQSAGLLSHVDRKPCGPRHASEAHVVPEQQHEAGHMVMPGGKIMVP